MTEELKEQIHERVYNIKVPTLGFSRRDLFNIAMEYAEPREERIAELEAQIEKMKNCKNCANYMISGKCPSFFRTGWCKNWEMTKE